jgi:tRNA-specific 2-thiouridylase
LQTSSKEKRIAVALSGGVDSAVAAALLLEQGCLVTGFFLVLAQPDQTEEIERAQAVAAQLAIPLKLIDLSTEFKKEIVDYFCHGYLHGITPNPCVVCNRVIKCGILASLTCPPADKLATGHYARISEDSKKCFWLLKGRDKTKDQSYFLCGLNQQQLGRLVFPLGEMTKDEVYERAAELGLADCHGRESQDICFLDSRDVADFLADQAQAGWQTGKIVDRAGQVLAAHKGLFRYTVGQRRGLGIPDTTPYYVLELDAAANRLIVGKEDELWQKKFSVTGVNWISGVAPHLPAVFMVKIRYRHPGALAELSFIDNKLVVNFKESQRAVTPGQFAVFYDDDKVIGSGEISR